MKWLANEHPSAASRNLQYVPEFGRWDDLYLFVGTPLEQDAFTFMKKQLALDLQSQTPSLLAKWLKSENTSSKESQQLAKKTREAFNMTSRRYRKVLSLLRERIRVVERLMSENRWDEIEFDKIPSRAGLIYKNAFARRDIIKEKYKAFAADKNTKVNAGTLYPYEVVDKAIALNARYLWEGEYDNTDRNMINKYWDNLTDYFNGKTFNGLAVVDTSGSMYGTPINVAISLGLYCAERSKGPFANHYVSFSSRPQLIKTEGIDFVDKVERIYRTNLCENTNLEATFDLLLNTAILNNCKQEDLPQNLVVISDMEFDGATYQRSTGCYLSQPETLMENISKKWEAHGYHMPHLIFWNVDARQNNIPMRDDGHITFVSGFSPVTFEMLLSGKTGQDIMYEKLNSERYSVIY
jgi:hypothetical protein